MKVRLTNYAFNPALKTISFPGQFALALAGFLLITNGASNTSIFNFADTSATASLSTAAGGNVLTLAYNTAAMNVSDPLTIWYEDGASPNSDVATALATLNQTQDEVRETLSQIRNGLVLLLNLIAQANITQADLTGMT